MKCRWMMHEHTAQHDAVAGGVGQDGLAGFARDDSLLFQPVFQARLHSAATVRDVGAEDLLQNRLSRNRRLPPGHARIVQRPGTQETAALLNPQICPRSIAQKGAFDSLLARIFSIAHEADLIEAKPEASIDATGLDDHHVSSHFRVKRKKHNPFVWRHWPKLTVVCKSANYLWCAATLSKGPSGDASEFAPCLTQACRHVKIHRLLADAGYDGEHHHRLAREALGVRSTAIRLNRRNAGRRWPKEKYRRQMRRRFPKRVYGHRWHVESSISQNKRRLGPAMRSRSDRSREAEIYCRVLTHNLMILRRTG